MNTITTTPDYIACRKCSSKDLTFEKYIGFGNKQGKVYHYMVRCLDCGNYYHVTRNSYVFNKVKDQKWIFSKSFIEHEQQTRTQKPIPFE